MDGQLLTLSKIFTERLFRIPDYQRGYAWTRKQLKDFWNDILQLEVGRNHYTGVLTLEDVQESTYSKWEDDLWIIESKSYQPFFIVDGQQRLTTAIILIQSVLERIEDGEKLNYTIKSDIQRRFIYDSKDDGISRSYIFGYEKDNPSYEFLKTKIFKEKSLTSTAEETVYTQNLERAKGYFDEMIKDYKRDDLEIVYKKVSQSLLFNIFTITEDVDVCVAFETMNNRGKPLSYLELLKNRLIFLSLKFSEPPYEREKLRRAINDCWKTLYHNLGRNKSHPLDDDYFLLTHYIIYFGLPNKEDELDRVGRFREISDYAEELLENRFIMKNILPSATDGTRLRLSDIYNYVSSIQESVKIWYVMSNPFDSSFSEEIKIWLDKLFRLNCPLPGDLVLSFILKVKYEERVIKFLKLMERYFFIRSIVSNITYSTYRRLSSSYSNIAHELYADKIDQNKVIKMLESHQDDFDSDKVGDSIVETFREDGFYQWKNIKYFLYEYNLFLQSQSKTSRRKILWPEFIEDSDDFITVEHIYPQNAKHKYWVNNFSKNRAKEKRLLRESLGNLLPLSKAKNASLSNKPFPEKVSGKSGLYIGYKYGSYAENEVAESQEWNAEEILKRGLQLLKFMEIRWDINLGDIKKKKKILGLSFME